MQRRLNPSFRRDERGLAFVEFAFLIPLLVVLFFGAYEGSRYIQYHQKADNALFAATDLINRQNQIDGEYLERVFDAVPSMTAPFDIGDFTMIVTSINFNETLMQPQKWWQCTSNPRGRESRVTENDSNDVNIPNLNMIAKEQVLSVELYIQYEPVFDNNIVRSILGLEGGMIYKSTIARPRFGSFQFEPDCP